MSSLATVPNVSIIPESIAVPRRVTVRRGILRKWLAASLVAVSLSPGLLVLPPVWHGVVRTVLTWQASRSGCELTVARISGVFWNATRLEGFHLRRRGSDFSPGTDVTIDRVNFTVAWRLPWLQRSVPWLKEVRLEGVSGRLDLTAGSPLGETSQRHTERHLSRWLPTNFILQADDLQLLRGTDSLRLSDFRLSGKSDAAGIISAREARVTAGDFTSIFTDWHGQTFWNDNRLELTGLDLGNGITLARAMLDASRIDGRRLTWDFTATAFSGELRGQGFVDFAYERVAVEVAATLQRIPLDSLAHALGIREMIGGRVDEASFTFHGDPKDLASAQMWLSARATGFQWGERHWESLDTQAVVVNRHVQIIRFDLRQRGNSLSISGEFSLPADDVTKLVWTGDGSWWQAAGFSCHVDARLEDLHALAELAGPDTPDLAGRMSINGQLSAAPHRAEIEGYLNVEGTRLTIRGAPVDFLRSTLLFRNNAMEVADVQATHDADYLTAHGVVGLSSEHPDRRGEVRAEIKDLSVYAPALAGLPGIGERAATIRHLDAVLRVEKSETVFDQWDGGQTGFLLAR